MTERMARRMYGAQGFTRTPAVRALLDALEVPYGVPGGSIWLDDPEPEIDDMARHDLELLQECWAEEDEAGGCVFFERLTVDGARRLLALLPAKQAFERQNWGPSLLEMVELGERVPGLLFHGYRVAPWRDDERITLTGFCVPAARAGEALALLRVMPDEWTAATVDGQAYFRAWWD